MPLLGSFTKAQKARQAQGVGSWALNAVFLYFPATTCHCTLGGGEASWLHAIDSQIVA